MDVEQAVARFIETEFSMDRDPPRVDPEEPLLDSGLVDSVGVLRLTAFIEETFDIQVSDDELVPENFQSVRSIASYVRDKLAARA